MYKDLTDYRIIVLVNEEFHGPGTLNKPLRAEGIVLGINIYTEFALKMFNDGKVLDLLCNTDIEADNGNARVRWPNDRRCEIGFGELVFRRGNISRCNSIWGEQSQIRTCDLPIDLLIPDYGGYSVKKNVPRYDGMRLAKGEDIWSKSYELRDKVFTKMKMKEQHPFVQSNEEVFDTLQAFDALNTIQSEPIYMNNADIGPVEYEAEEVEEIVIPAPRATKKERYATYYMAQPINVKQSINTGGVRTGRVISASAPDAICYNIAKNKVDREAEGSIAKVNRFSVKSSGTNTSSALSSFSSWINISNTST